MDKQYNVREILDRLPHRYPFILVDRILELERGVRVTGLKNVTINEPFFSGHFPGNPVMPGVLILEAMGQAGAVLALESWGMENNNRLLYLMSMDRAKFRKPVFPGDQLVLRLEVIKLRSRAVKMSGKALVDETVVAESVFTAALGDKNDTSNSNN